MAGLTQRRRLTSPRSARREARCWPHRATRCRSMRARYAAKAHQQGTRSAVLRRAATCRARRSHPTRRRTRRGDGLAERCARRIYPGHARKCRALSLRHLGAYATAAQAVRVRARFVLRLDVARRVPEKFAPRFSDTLSLDSLHALDSAAEAARVPARLPQRLSRRNLLRAPVLVFVFRGDTLPASLRRCAGFTAFLSAAEVVAITRDLGSSLARMSRRTRWCSRGS